ncbi:DUF257 family protein [Pyrococcus sp. ST04]|uniref:DUF257 family protein n=1 Tax=Pyrococcus sp. ST04 TaxID=1183377 RepID=UPI0002605E72|nr:DUF257 family protein [Pyrococcus sp. ST04]AFK23187.1 hypothetical protein Py04_1617 [Pyrococcus sp. ST04]
MKIRSFLEDIKQGIVLIEYFPPDHPEKVLYELLTYFKDKNIRPLLIDIRDTLHVFLQQLKLQGIDIDAEGYPTIKEGGKVKIGKIIGSINVFEDFEHHLGKYLQLCRDVPDEIKKVTIVLGINKFLDQINQNYSIVERYFEVIGRRHLEDYDRLVFIFINVAASSQYFLKSFEEYSDYVVRVTKGGEFILQKIPGGET